eukprot:9790610-Ditylum_brightwellii.AAC.1
MAALRDWLIVGIYTRNRKNEWAQEHENSKKSNFALLDIDGSSKAFTQRYMVFLRKNGKHLCASDSAIVQDDEVEFMEL